MRRLAALLLALASMSPLAGPVGHVKTCTATERATVGCASGDGASLTIGGEHTTESESYGDGTTTTLTTGGRTWAALSQPQFTPTATSHVYRTRGTYMAEVTVHYTAEVDLGTGWFTVPGELTTPGPSQQIRIFQAHTALVAHTCTEKPTAPGC